MDEVIMGEGEGNGRDPSPAGSGALYGALRAGTVLYARADALLTRLQLAVQNVAGGFLGEALTLPEQSDLGVRLYGTRFRGTAAPPRLSDWERAWFGRRLPPPPARLLVGAAGTGREARVLCDLGYRVDALEPAAGPARTCAQALGANSDVVVARYEDLSRSVLDAGAGAGAAAADVLAARRYDAILLGWGSLMHVLGAHEQRRLLEACARLAPAGPILASFWLRPEDGESDRAGRAERAGRALGRLVQRARGAPGGGTGATFGSSYGFAHAFTRAEIEALADAVNRRVLWDEQTVPHVTFAPRDDPARAAR
jgi:hypothetical protein